METSRSYPFKVYADKLDGKIPQDFFDRKNEEWRTEQKDILRKIENHQNANRSYLNEGVHELSQKAVILYERQEVAEKRRILDFVFSNCTWKDGKLIPSYRKPFDMIAETNVAYQKEKAVNPKKDGLVAIWLPFVHSFRTFFLVPTKENANLIRAANACDQLS